MLGNERKMKYKREEKAVSKKEREMTQSRVEKFILETRITCRKCSVDKVIMT